MLKFNYIIPLGGGCQLTYQLRRAFNFGTAFPLDWWVTNMRGVIDALDPGKDPYDDLTPFLNPGGENKIAHIRTGNHNIELHHEFPRGEDKCVLPDWREHTGRARERFRYLRNRLLQLNEKSSNILFVRHKGNKIIGETTTTNAASVDDMIDYVNSVFTRSHNTFLLINAPDSCKPSDVLALSLDDAQHDNWRGDHERWRRALTEITLENPALKPFTDKTVWEIW